MIRTIVVFLLSAAFVAAAVLHFTQTAAFASIVPAPLPAKIFLVQLTGAIEGVLGLLLLPPRTRALSGKLLALYALAVLPANIQHALDGTPIGSLHLPAWALWLRVVLQAPLIALILWATKRR
ncbi:hypothetical protein RDV64_05010 [Acuticoccus sp. MNP-M23]|uniref:DoxX family protein n=1 Tax=Acuticoccus sp. MNP-M23 TaxID=3072793 RepID=UPI002814DB7F|nr:hypothetical protein [Acuticoccus sp. MNP-M23]WMS43762.1 hypothetical protein RDV64_05010 [Acuticoccus sp. MNP-M23]